MSLVAGTEVTLERGHLFRLTAGGYSLSWKEENMAAGA